MTRVMPACCVLVETMLWYDGYMLPKFGDDFEVEAASMRSTVLQCARDLSALHFTRKYPFYYLREGAARM